jgi:hypothetical protein
MAMMQIVTIGFIRARRAKIDSEIARQHEIIAASEAAIAELRAKREDLDTAERVISEILIEEGILDRGDTEIVPPNAETAVETPPENGNKPEGIPSIPDMITEAVRDALERGDKGVEPVMMTAFIRARWWPGVSPEKVSPIAWRMWRRGQLTKKGSAYALPPQKRTGANGATQRVS